MKRGASSATHSIVVASEIIPTEILNFPQISLPVKIFFAIVNCNTDTKLDIFQFLIPSSNPRPLA